MRYYQIGFPRSGSHWLRYIAKYFLKIDKPYYFDDNEGSLYKHTHAPAERDIRDKNRGLILILRNFKECIQRHRGQYNEEDLQHYIRLISSYDKWENKKILIFYEDLITQPNIEIVRFGKFLNMDYKEIYFFLRDYDFHREKSIDYYGASMSDCKSKIYHSKNLNSELWNSYALSIIPNNLVKYIKGYL